MRLEYQCTNALDIAKKISMRAKIEIRNVKRNAVNIWFVLQYD